MTVNENLERECASLKESGSGAGKAESNDAQDEIRRLQAQNTALQKSLTCKCSVHENFFEPRLDILRSVSDIFDRMLGEVPLWTVFVYLTFKHNMDTKSCCPPPIGKFF